MHGKSSEPQRARLTIGNIEFDRVITNSIERELYWAELLAKGGISRIASLPGESTQAYSKRATDQVKGSGLFPDLLAMQVSFAGQPWSRETQETIAFFFTHLRGTDDVPKMLELAESMALELKASQIFAFTGDSKG